MRFSRRGAAAVLALAAFPAISPAAAIFTDGFDTTGSSSSYATFITAGATGPSGDATFAYNYGAAPGSGGLSIPVAPHTTDGSTTGLRVRTDNLQSTAAGAVGASEVTTKNLQLPKKYTVQVDVWSNYIGGSNISASGSNGSTGVNVGIGTTSTTSDTINANNGAMYEAYGDNGGGTNSAYRVYNDNTHALPTDTTNYYQAGNGANSATFSDPYYTSKFPSVSAPAGQVSFASATQGGSTPAGVQGFNWHTWTITQDGTNITWAIDGKNISIVPDSKVTLAGQQVSLGNDDGGLTGSSAANNQLFNAEIFDNLNVTTIGPEAWLSSAPMLPQGGTAGGTATITGSATHYLATGVATPAAGTTATSIALSQIGAEAGTLNILVDLDGTGNLTTLASSLLASLPASSTVTASPNTPDWAAGFGGSWDLLVTIPNPTGTGANDFFNLDLDSSGFTIDRVAAIPEPTTASVVALGAFGLMARRRKTA
jgi:hypothetical protein